MPGKKSFSFAKLAKLSKILKKIEVGARDRFIPPAEKLLIFFPFLPLEMKQAKMSQTAEEYLAECFSGASAVFVSLSVFLALALSRLKAAQTQYYAYAIILPLVLSLMFFVRKVMYPKLLIIRRVKSIEQNLLFALRSMLINISSGVPIFNAFVTIASGGYGEISEEFAGAVRRISSGEEEEDVLEQMALENPSLYFRRALWQLSNGMRAGSDVSRVLREVTRSLSKERLIQIEQYGSKLNPMALMYMMVAVILPSLGVTMLIILSSLSNATFLQGESTFWGIYVLVLFFQIVFIGMIKSSRPNMLGDES